MSGAGETDISVVPIAELRVMLAQAMEAERLAAWDDCHLSFIRRADDARAAQLRLLAEIARREAHYEAINGQ